MKFILLLSLVFSLSAFADDNTVQPTPTDNDKATDFKEDIKGTLTPGSQEQSKQIEENKKAHEQHVKKHVKAKPKKQTKKAPKKSKSKAQKKSKH